MNGLSSKPVTRDDQTVLIVDDNTTNIRVLTTLLESQGYTTLIARNGEGALETAVYALPDLILLDVMMPGMDGFETCRRLKANPKTNEIPVIFMTALSHTEKKVEGFQVGAVDYVVKPLQHEEVLARVSTHLRLQALTHNLQKQNEWLIQMTLQQNTIQQIGQKILSILDLDALHTAVASLIQAQFSYYFVGLWLADATSDNLTLQAAAGTQKGNLPPLDMRLSRQEKSSLTVDAFVHKQTLFIDDMSEQTHYTRLKSLPQTRAMVALPLQMQETILGVLDIQSQEANAFADHGKMALGNLANQIAIAIRNARRYREDVKANQRG